MGNILVLSGKKQSGKNTASNFIHGYLMHVFGVTRMFDIDEHGNLLVYAEQTDENGNILKGMGVLDLNRTDEPFVQYASSRIWPIVHNYSYADNLKQALIHIFNLTYEQCYGTDDDKNSPSTILWKDISFIFSPKRVKQLKDEDLYNKPMAARQLLQVFGTDICRRIKFDCWSRSCLELIKKDNSTLAIITDARFPDEIDIAREYGAKSLRLLRNPLNDDHKSETALDNYTQFDVVLDNSSMNIKEQNQAVLDILRNWGWIDAVV